ncbi:hypothetical protein [Aquimarina sp. 2201CG14-23]|uniref:hypothetical protein n=1 Tax=Aquimarina mycalae TaxID=3040073 RepID=UPI0024780557|nr:hypothetical protein [Aquimarina sp. 2201CG14-23]MDH7447632.1 hypothetical protein [Aquimarina sp. 2201CG14-23]
MTIEEAKNLIHYEYESDDGLDLLFRMSADVEEERIRNFLEALKSIEQYYADKKTIEKKLVYQLFSMNQTLRASMGHWKASRPEGLDTDTCFKIFDGIRNVFSK